MAEENTHHNNFEELCAGYVLHALDDEERREFENMLNNASEDEIMLYQKMKSAANQLSFAVERHEPDPVLKERLMDQITSSIEKEQEKEEDISVREDDQDTDIEQGFEWSSLGLATSFALLIITLSLLFYSFTLQSEINDNQSVIEEQETQIAELEEELDQKDEMLAVLGSREVEMVEMSGMEKNPSGHGKIIWNDENPQALLQVANLPPSSSESVYQLWILTGDKPISADVFTVSSSAEQFFLIENFTSDQRQAANGFAVTLEPEGGSQQLTGDMYLMGNME